MTQPITFDALAVPPAPVRPDAGDVSGPWQSAECDHGQPWADADRFAASVRPIVEQLQLGGITSYRGIASALNSRGIRTAHGGDWQVSNVRNLIRRSCTLKPL